MKSKMSGKDPQAWEYPESAIAIVGMACKFAGAESVEEFWDIIQSGASLCREVPEERFSASRVRRRPGAARFFACLLDDVESFDHKVFKVSSREAASMDPQQRLSLQVAYQAAESAGYFGNEAWESHRDMGCYLGVCANEYDSHVACHAPNAFSTIGTLRPFIPGKISHLFGWTGPSIAYDTACASSGTAIHAACRAIIDGECTAALAGGVAIFNSPEVFQNLAAGHFTSPTGACKPFDAAADGYCRGEGIGMVVLKKLEEAIRDGDTVMGVIAATSISQNANDTSITVPHGPSQMALYRKTLRLSGLSAHDISFVEAHGTGTPVGDPIEADSIRGVFGGKNREETLYMGSVKSNVGHTEAASCVAGLIKTVLMLHHKTIPRQALFKKLNSKISALHSDRVAIATENVPWGQSFKAACINSYGASGSNAAMILMEPPSQGSISESIDKPKLSFSRYPITISAFSATSLALCCAALCQYLDRSKVRTDKVLANVSYNLSRRRNPKFPCSLCATVSSLDELKDILKPGPTRDSHQSKLASDPRPLVLTFSGQTSNIVEVPKMLYQSSAIFRKHLDDCDAALQDNGFESIYPAIFDPRPVEDLILLHTMQFSQQYACAKAWLDAGVRVSLLVGHSLGHFTALCVAGVLSLHDSVKLVAGRARLIQRRWGPDRGSMMAIEADESKLSKIITKLENSDVKIACYNAPQSHVVSGSTESIEALEHHLSSSIELSSLRRKRLNVTHAFHSSLTKPILAPLQSLAEQCIFHEPSIPIETCSRESQGSPRPEFVAAHTREPVFFTQTLERISARLGPCSWLEAGTGSVMQAMVRRALGPAVASHQIQPLNLASSDSFAVLSQAIIDLWKLGQRPQFWPFHKSQRHDYASMNLPPYQYEKSLHWLEWKELGQNPSDTLPQRSASPAERSLISLSEKTKTGAVFAIDPQCREWQTIVAGYEILDVPRCPPSMYVEFATRAATVLQEKSGAAKLVPSFEDMTFRTPLGPEPVHEVLLRLDNFGNPFAWEFSVDSRAGPDSRATQHASGMLSFFEANDAKVKKEFSRYQRLTTMSHTTEIIGDLKSESLRGKAVYKSLSEMFRSVEAYQGVKVVSANGLEAAGYVDLPVNDSMKTFLTNPVAIDCFVQVASLHLNSLGNRGKHEAFVNAAIGRVQVAASLDFSTTKSTSWIVYSNAASLEENNVTCDIYVFNPHSEQLSMVLLEVEFLKATIGNSPQLHAPGSEKQEQLAVASEDEIDSENGDVVEPEKKEVSTGPTETSSRSDLPESPTLDSLPDLDKTLYDLLARVADVETTEVNNDSLLVDLGIDSLMGMEVLEEINKEFSINLDMDDFADLSDMESLCKLIESKTAKFSRTLTAITPQSSDSDGLGQATPARSTARTTPLEHGLANDEKQEVLTPASPLGTARPPSLHSQSPGSSQLSAEGVREAFTMIQGDFDKYAKEARCDKFWTTAYPPQAELVTAYIVEAFAKLGCDLRGMAMDQTIPEIQHVPKHDRLINQLMNVLRDHGLITRAKHKWTRTTKPIPSQTSSQMLEKILQDFPQNACEHVLLDTTGSKLAECLSGAVDPLFLLFQTRQKRALMEEVYTNGPMQLATTHHIGSFIAHCFGPQTTKEPFHILEVGGGTGGTSKHIVGVLAQLGIPVTYTFTDISPSLVKSAKDKIGKHSFVKFRSLDLEQEIPTELHSRFHMVLATNVMHATSSLDRCAAHARQMLRPDGFLALLEFNKNIYWFDLVFGLLDGWWLHSDGRRHALVDEFAWERVLKRTGFQHVDWTGGESRESSTFRILLAYQSTPSNLPSMPKPYPWTLETINFKETGQNLLFADVYIPDGFEENKQKKPIGMSCSLKDRTDC